MPKVAEGFYDKRREEILDAARAVAMKKPLGSVTMKDIIRRCGVSQGAIYHYFAGVDEIWLSMIGRFYRNNGVAGALQALFESGKAPAVVVKEAAGLLCEDLKSTVPEYGKLIMELNTLILANPALYEKMEALDKGRTPLDALNDLFAGWYDAAVGAGELRPRVSREQVLLMVGSTYLGLRYHATMLALQPGEAIGLQEYLRLQAESWTVAMLYLLGLEEEEV